LACVAVTIKPEENGDPLYGETFLTVLAAPHAAPMGGAPLAPTDVWPGLETLGPAGFKMDLNDEMHLLAASVQPNSRSLTTSTVSSTRDSYLEHLVYTTEGDEMCSVGFVALDEAPSGLNTIFIPSNLAGRHSWL
jgi:hypothetical protein